MNRISLILPLLFLFTLSLSAQEVVATAGNEFTASNQTLSWTMGEVVIETFTVENAAINQGFHQSVIIITNIDTEIHFPIEIEVYPNPTSSTLTVSYSAEVAERVTYMVYNLSGNCMTAGVILNSKTELDFSSYAPGVYILRLIDSKGKVNSLRIVKD